MLHQGYRPRLKRFLVSSVLLVSGLITRADIVWTYREYSMIGEEESLRDNIPSSIPWHIFLINEESHELRNSERWVRLQQSEPLECAQADDDLRRSTGSIHLQGK